MKKIFLAVIILIAAATVAAADTIYLRDGRTIHGTLLGFINGRFVVRVELRYSTPPSATTDPSIARNRTSEGEIQYFRPNEVERIEIEGRSLDDARFEIRNLQVTLDPNWIDSGIDIRRGPAGVPTGLKQVISELNKLRKNDRLYIKVVSFQPGVVIGGEEFPSLPPSMAAVINTDRSSSRSVSGMANSTIREYELPQSKYVIQGQRSLNLTIKPMG